MSHETLSIESLDPPADAAPHGRHLAAGQAGSFIRRWLQRAASTLEQAERRITENFRVPPGGG